MPKTRTLKARFVPALIDYEPYEDPEDPNEPSFAPYSMMGQCPIHGCERITAEGTTPGFDPTAYYKFACGKIDIERF